MKIKKWISSSSLWFQILICLFGFVFLIRVESLNSDSREWVLRLGFLVFLGLAIWNVLKSKKDLRISADLEKLYKMRSDFVANVSHELRTPLTSIQGYADLLEIDLAEKRYEAAQESAGAISRNTKRLLDLCSDLLVLSKYESPASEVQNDWIQGSEVALEAIAILNPRKEEKGHEIVVTGGSTPVYCNKNRLLQVVVNLTDNAIRYLPSHGRIEIQFTDFIFSQSLALGDSAEQYSFSSTPQNLEGTKGVLVSVQDNGPGIAKVHLERLFERFYRVDKGRSRDMGGTGLGLAIVKHIVELHGGWVRVSSEVGQGAKFDCFFPSPR
jgi:two-component system phosphate regulon sensor histidine kinase PhoR